MFSQLQDLESWTWLVQRALITFAALALAPPALLALGMLALLLVPVAVVGIPFMLPAFFGGAVAEHEETLRVSRYPQPLAAHAV